MTDSLFWSTRGDCVFITDPKAIKESLNKGFVRLNEEELKRFKAGSYHPAHDSGTQSTPVSLQPIHIQPQSNSQPFQVITL